MIYDERLTVREQHVALDLLQESIQLWLYDDQLISTEINRGDTIYVISTYPLDELLTFCISWNGRNSRSYERCEQVKK